MSKARNISNLFSASTDVSTDAEVTAAIASHAAAADPHTGYLKESEYNVAGKNLAINGAFDIWQRGTSFTGITAGNTYVADRWSTATAGTYNVYVSRQLTNDTTNLPNIQYCLRYGRTAGTTGTNWNILTTSFETSNSIPFVGKTIILSFYARAGANFSSSGNSLHSFVLSGTGTDQNANVAYTGQQFSYASHTLTSNWQRFTNIYTVPSNATELAVSIQYVPSGTAGANDWYEITGVQLELGSQPTNFSRAGGDIQGELAACQRYFQRYGTGGGYFPLCIGQVINSNTAYGFLPFKVTMRGTPSLSTTATGGAVTSSNRSFFQTSNFGSNVIEPNFVEIFAQTSSSVLTAGDATEIFAYTGVVDISAEL